LKKLFTAQNKLKINSQIAKSLTGTGYLAKIISPYH